MDAEARVRSPSLIRQSRALHSPSRSLARESAHARSRSPTRSLSPSRISTRSRSRSPSRPVQCDSHDLKAAAEDLRTRYAAAARHRLLSSEARLRDCDFEGEARNLVQSDPEAAARRLAQYDRMAEELKHSDVAAAILLMGDDVERSTSSSCGHQLAGCYRRRGSLYHALLDRSLKAREIVKFHAAGERGIHAEHGRVLFLWGPVYGEAPSAVLVERGTYKDGVFNVTPELRQVPICDIISVFPPA